MSVSVCVCVCVCVCACAYACITYVCLHLQCMFAMRGKNIYE